MGSIYRSRLKGKYSSETSHFVSSLIDDSRILEDDLSGTEAHDIMLYEQSLLSRYELGKILNSLENLRREWVEGRLKLEGEFEDIHELIEAYVIREIGSEIGGKLHSGRSRNDQVATDIRMQLRDSLLRISQAILNLVKICILRAEKEKVTPILLYTHTQQAQIGTLGHYLLAFSYILIRDFQRIQDCYDRVNMSPLGAGPIGGTNIPIDRRRTALLLGFDGIVNNSLDASSSRDFVVESVASMANLMTNVSRFSEDIILWSSSEFGFVEIADELASVSSIMPQKKNPTVLELIRGKTSRIDGNLIAILGILKALPSGYSSDLQEMKPLIWDSLDITFSSIEILTNIVGSLIIHVNKIVEAAQKSYVFAVDLAERLTLEGILPFRQAHIFVGSIVNEMVSKGISPSNLTLNFIEMMADKVLGHQIPVPSSALEDAVNPKKCVDKRISLGSPSSQNVELMLIEVKNLVLKAEEVLVTRSEKLENSKSNLSVLVKQYMETKTSENSV